MYVKLKKVMKLYVDIKEQKLYEYYYDYVNTNFDDKTNEFNIFLNKNTIIKSGEMKVIEIPIICTMRKYNNMIRNTDLYTNVPYIIVPDTKLHLTPLRNVIGIQIITNFTENIKVYFDNISDEDYTIKEGTVLCKIMASDFTEFDIAFH